MKFCKNLQHIASISDPEWAPYWMNYKMLKKIIKELPSLVSVESTSTNNAQLKGSRETSEPVDKPLSSISCDKESNSFQQQQQQQQQKQHQKQQQQHHGDDSSETPDIERKVSSMNSIKVNKTRGKQKTIHRQDLYKDMGKNPGEVAFFKLLHAELKKASQFFTKAQQEVMIREERIREGMEIMKTPNSILVNDKWSCLKKSLYRLYKDLLLLETFAIMTYCSFSKILKKHDKVTNFETRVPFMSKVVNQANFTSYPELLSMIDRCESLFDNVSQNQLAEGNTSLCEDEELFISMIHRLNSQIMERAEKEGVPARDQIKGNQKRRRVAIGNSIPYMTSSSKQRPRNTVTSSLMSLVKENEEGSVTSSILSDDTIEKSTQLRRDAQNIDDGVNNLSPKKRKLSKHES
mmetsp:Transcript_10685/g.15068  ORF Transcript_10685/g.15068 Transcript_10685/m.15068 type:complete len:406 (+) Transcript_10685:137-1354(+)|eukprot:CAMPEP_0184865082 /NCGR_PEP_ID=MMETSP0580-20130426/16903_1 /TAXON_ID=1118495 /ORGANISM="Dactyliosolen fragilissimus" /LENGTH=405 /DNA_ID=CAMNT_0027364119 /DNA_START=121 /DNA_END=1338 /DNA_ORIENTATION=-